MIRVLVYGALSAALTLCCMLLVPDARVHAEWIFPLVLIGAGSVSYVLVGWGTVNAKPHSSGERRVIAFVVFAVVLAGLSAATGWVAPTVLTWVGLAALAEEMVFRYFPWLLMRRIEVARRWIAPLVTSLFFVAFHPLGDPWLVIDRLAFGVGAYILCAISGTLLIPLAVHVVSNLIAPIVVSIPMVMPLGPVVLVLDVVLLMGSIWFVRREIARRSSLTRDLHCNTI